MIQKITEYYINKKCRRTLNRIDSVLGFPVAASSIKKVLLFLPAHLERLDDANRFARLLRDTYQGWTVDIFDVDKLKKEDFNRLNAPNFKILTNLKDAKYDLVIDLNEEFHLTSAFLAVMTEAPYRLNLDTSGQSYFNIQYAASQAGEHSGYDQLLGYLQKLFPQY